MKNKVILTILLSGLCYMGMAGAFTLKSNVILPDQPFPPLYTCDGRDKVPDLSWFDIPAGTQSFVLILADPDAPSGIWYHWVVFNIPVSVQQWQPETLNLPAGVLMGQNSWKKTDYNGPCPPLGKDHHYVFTIYALDSLLNLPAGATGPQVLQAMQDHILGQAQLVGIYQRSIDHAKIR